MLYVDSTALTYEVCECCRLSTHGYECECADGDCARPSLTAEILGEPFFSDRPCEHCGQQLAGDRYRAAVADDSAFTDAESAIRNREFNSVFQVTPGGYVIDGPDWLTAPDVEHDDECDVIIPSEWRALTGYTGQHGYRGAVMHSSEYLGGRLLSDILDTPGVYAIATAEVYCHTLGHDYDDCPVGRDHSPAGWVVVQHRTEGLPEW